MPRIRSVHPGQWTDENFVSCRPTARLLALGLRNEADDQGIFEWKPLTLKMRLFAADINQPPRPETLEGRQTWWLVSLLPAGEGAGWGRRLFSGHTEVAGFENFQKQRSPTA